MEIKVKTFLWKTDITGLIALINSLNLRKL